jgi:alpha-L-arabinofuranosidase
VEGPTFDSSLEGKSIPVLDAVASRSADGKQVFIKVVNTDPSEPFDTQITLTGIAIAHTAKIETLNGDTVKTANDFSHPDAVRVTSNQIEVGRSFTVRLPAHSVSVISVEVEH